ncbi:MAG: carboxypeptidase-like regulatory domain-containing protein [Planctomycetota bacterium]
MPPKHPARPRLAFLGYAAAALVTAAMLWILTGSPRTPDSGPAVVAAQQEREHDLDERPVADLLAPTGEKDADAPASSDSRAEIEMASTLVLRAKVARGVLSDATVRVLEHDVAVGIPDAGRTDRRGRARFRVPPDTDVTVEVTHERMKEPFRKELRTAPSEGSKTVVLRLGDLIAPAPVELLVVTDHSGEPIAGATVEILGPRNDGDREVLGEVETDEDGRVVVPWNEGGRVRANAPGHSRRSLDMRGGAADLELRLHAHAWIRGTLSEAQRILARGAPPELEFGLGRLPDTRNTSRPIRVEDIDTIDRYDPAREAMRVATGLPWFDAKGRWLVGPIKFTRPEPEPKEYDVVVEIDGMTRTLAKDVVVRPGDELVVEDLFAAAAPLDLQLLYDGDFDPPGAWGVFLGPAGSGRWGVSVMTTSTDEGRVRLDALPKGKWDVYLKPEYRTDRLELLATFEHLGEPDCIAVMRDHVPLKGVMKGLPSTEGINATAWGLGRMRKVECDASGAFDLSPARRGAALTLTFDSFVFLGGSEEMVEVDGKIQIGSASQAKTESRRFEVVADGADLTLEY